MFSPYQRRKRIFSSYQRRKIIKVKNLNDEKVLSNTNKTYFVILHRKYSRYGTAIIQFVDKDDILPLLRFYHRHDKIKDYDVIKNCK